MTADIADIQERMRARRAKPALDGPLATQDDFGLAARLLTQHGQRLRWAAAEKTWAVYDGTRWRLDDTDEAQAIMTDLIDQLPAAEADYYDDTPVGQSKLSERDRFLQWAAKQRTHKHVQAALSTARGLRGFHVRMREFDADPWLLNARNGTVDLRTGVLHPHNPEQLHTMRAEVDFDPDARAPQFEQFMNRTVPDPAAREHIRRYLGYCLTGDLGAQKLPILQGPGATGKSQLIDMLTRLMGDYAAPALEGSLLDQRGDQHPEGIAATRGKRVIFTSETNVGRAFNEALIKKLTSSEEVSARRLYGHTFHFKPTAKILVTTNNPLRVSSDGAMWRRLLLWEFNQVVPENERVADYGQHLAQTEGPGILNWLLAGLRAYLNDGLAVPETVETATASWREDEDVIGRWIEDACEISPDAVETTEALISSHNLWLRNNGYREISVTHLSRMLHTRGFEKTRARVQGRRMRAFNGIRVTPRVWGGGDT